MVPKSMETGSPDSSVRRSQFHQPLAYTDDFDLAERLAAWEECYNVHRPHGGLGGLTPYEVLKEKMAS
jgi:transposase InsO family protein